MAKSLIECPVLWRLGPQGIERLCGDPPFPDSEHPATDGRPTLIATPHLGSWEFSGLICALQAPMTSMYSPLADAWIDQWVRNGRETTGARLLPASGEGLHAMHRALKSGEFVGILPDETPRGASGVFAPFFGRPALTMTLLGKLARSGNPPPRVVFVAAERLPQRRGFRMHAVEPGMLEAGVLLPEFAPNATPEEDAATVNTLVKALVCHMPEQYNWSYRRSIPPAPGPQSPYRHGTRWARGTNASG